MTLDNHIQEPESYEQVRDEQLRNALKLAVTRAAYIDWPLFMAFSDGRKDVYTFDAGWTPKLSQFLCASAHYAFPRNLPEHVYHRPRVDPGVLEFSRIADGDLRQAVERIQTRATELKLWCVMVVAGRRQQCLFSAILPGEDSKVVDHLVLCFAIALEVSGWDGGANEENRPKPGELSTAIAEQYQRMRDEGGIIER